MGSHLGDLGGTTRPSTAPPAPQVKVDQPHRESWSRSRSRPKPSTPPASTSHLPTTLLSLAPAASSLQPFVLHQSSTSRCSTPPVSTESLPLSPSSAPLPSERNGRPAGPNGHLLASQPPLHGLLCAG